jgi:hypothetical protein
VSLAAASGAADENARDHEWPDVQEHEAEDQESRDHALIEQENGKARLRTA